MKEIEKRIARLKFRAWHRGTREADFLIGGFFDSHHAEWSEAEIAWFESLLDEDDADVMAWAMGKAPVPEQFGGDAMQAMQKLDYVCVSR